MTLRPLPRLSLPSVEVLLRPRGQMVHEMMEAHVAQAEPLVPQRPSGASPGESADDHVVIARKRATGIPDSARAALALNTLTEEGLPHFHRLLAVHLGEDSHWRRWNNMWTAEEDRHGAVLHDYLRDTRLLHQRRLEEMQYSYLESGFHPDWDTDPYRVFVHTTLQERATQVSHSGTGRAVADYEPLLNEVLPTSRSTKPGTSPSTGRFSRKF